MEELKNVIEDSLKTENYPRNSKKFKMTTEAKFQAAVRIIRSLPKDGPYQPSYDMMLKFYGLYKQAVEGPCTEPKPAFYEVVKGYKWKAWHNLGDMSKIDAMNCYVDELKKIIETMSYSEDVAAFMDALGPFYEFVDIPGKKLKNVNTNGVPEDEQPNSHNGETEDREKCELNGHLPIHKRSGNADSGSDSDSDMAHLSSEDSSPQQVSVVTTEPIEVSLARELTEASEEKAEFNQEEDEELLVVKVHEVENTTTHTFSLSPNAYSDSESDEEYSEPAELNTQPSQTSTTAWSQPVILDGVVSAVTSTDGVTSADGVASADAVTCGGGDQSHPGGLQMTPRQIQQGSRCDGSSQAASRVSSGSLSTPLHPGRYFQSGGGSGGSGGAGGGWGGTSLTEDVNTQLVIVLRRLQTDMESVLHRLNTLETLTVTQHHTVCRHCQRGNGSMSNSNGHTEASWWPFPELSPRSTFFLLVWPLVLHGGIKLLLLLRSRRRRS